MIQEGHALYNMIEAMIRGHFISTLNSIDV